LTLRAGPAILPTIEALPPASWSLSP